MTSMNTIFKIKTKDGYILKILSELLQNIIKNGLFRIDKNCITLRSINYNKTMLIDLKLNAENFNLYKYKSTEDFFYININLTHFHKMLKSIKKKDSVLLSITKDNPHVLNIIIIPKEKDRKIISQLIIQDIVQIEEIELPVGYDNSIIIPSNEYQKMCKDMNNISTKIKIISQKYYIKFKCNADIYSREAIFGEFDEDSDNESNNIINNSYEQLFDTEQLTRINKISGLDTNIYFYINEKNKSLPIYIMSKIGNLGYIGIFIKNNDQKDDDE